MRGAQGPWRAVCVFLFFVLAASFYFLIYLAAPLPVMKKIIAMSVSQPQPPQRSSCLAVDSAFLGEVTS